MGICNLGKYPSSGIGQRTQNLGEKNNLTRIGGLQLLQVGPPGPPCTDQDQHIYWIKYIYLASLLTESNLLTKLNRWVFKTSCLVLSIILNHCTP